MIIFTFTLIRFIIPFLFWITFCTIEFAFAITWNMFCYCFSFIVVSYHIIKFFNMYVFCFFWNTYFGDKALQHPVHLFKLIMNGLYLSSTGFILTRAGLTMHKSSFTNRHFVRLCTKEILKVYNMINRVNIILWYFFSLNTCECWICQICQ